MIVVRTVRPIVYETEVVEIRWRLKDGTTYVHRISCPPRATRQARDDEQERRRTLTLSLDGQSYE